MTDETFEALCAIVKPAIGQMSGTQRGILLLALADGVLDATVDPAADGVRLSMAHVTCGAPVWMSVLAARGEAAPLLAGIAPEFRDFILKGVGANNFPPGNAPPDDNQQIRAGG